MLRTNFRNRSGVAYRHVVGLLACLACAPSGSPPARGHGDESKARILASLREELERRSAESAFTLADISVTWDTSRVVPGLMYVWGILRPPNSADVQWDALVATRDSVVQVVREPTDWVAVAGPWRAQDSLQVLDACAEVIKYAGPRADPFNRPQLYVDTTTLRGLAVLGDDMIRIRATSPQITRTGPAWLVSFWMIEMGQTTLYECRIGAGLDLKSVTALKGTGFMQRSP